MDAQECSVTKNFHAFFLKKCEENGLDPIEVAKGADVAHQVFTTWKKKDPKTIQIMDRLLATIEIMSVKAKASAVA